MFGVVWEMIDFREEVISTFLSRVNLSANIENGFEVADNLINGWIAFDAFVTKRYWIDGVGKRIEEFCNEFQCDYEQKYNSLPQQFKLSLIQLSHCKILDRRPTKDDGRYIEINDIKNLKNIFDVVYRIRNNLFHGGKNMVEESNKVIVYSASMCLYYILKEIAIN